MTISSQDIDDFFGRYAAALTNFDAGASADLWATPGTIVDDRFSGVLDSRDAMVSGLEQSYPVYKQLGLASVGYEIVDERPFSDRLVLVAVRWTFLDANGDTLTDSNPSYLLRREDSGLRATVCIQTDDMEKLQALAESRGVDLASRSE